MAVSTHCVLRGNTRNTFQCNACHYPTSPITGALFEGAKPGLAGWFLAIHLIGEAKIRLSAHALKRTLGQRSGRFDFINRPHAAQTRSPNAQPTPCSPGAADAPIVGCCGLRSAP